MEITLTSIGGDEDSDFEENENSVIEGVLSFYINARYMIGGEAEYLKEGDIVYSDTFETSFNPSTSKTDALQISLGLNFSF